MVGVGKRERGGQSPGEKEEGVRNKRRIGGKEVMKMGMNEGGDWGRRQWRGFRVGFDQEGRLESWLQEGCGRD